MAARRRLTPREEAASLCVGILIWSLRHAPVEKAVDSGDSPETEPGTEEEQLYRYLRGE